MSYIETVPEIVLTDEQEGVVAAADRFMADWRQQLFYATGLAGTGKTTVLRFIADQYEHAYACAFTGKAASVLRRKGVRRACTLHSAIYRLREIVRPERAGRKPQLIFDPQHAEGALIGQLILVDEVSMISEEFGRDLVDTGAKIIGFGDHGQLPPVKGLPFFNRPDCTLQEIHRQALESPIIRQAHAVRENGAYEADGCFRVVRNEVSDDDLRAADVILCWTNRTRHRLNSYSRRIRGLFQPTPAPGEPIVCMKNAKDYGVFNGAVYTLIAPFMEGDTTITLDVDGDIRTIPNVKFDGVNSGLSDAIEPVSWFGFGYAMTVHKSQGSEWPSVVLFDEYRRAEERRQWLYTAITRASERILVVR